MKLDELTLCQMIDHTLLKADAKQEDFYKLCNEAKQYHFKMVAVNPYPVKFCKQLLNDSDVHVGAAISFPLGQTAIETKVNETKQAIIDGADEIDYVLNIAKVKDKDYDYINNEMKTLINLCHESNVLIKVIFENCYLDEEEITNLAKIAKLNKPDFIKTSTGFGSYGALVKDVKLMKDIVGDEVGVKAAGGIRDLETCKKMILAGAGRIGTSSSIKIIDELRKEK